MKISLIAAGMIASTVTALAYAPAWALGDDSSPASAVARSDDVPADLAYVPVRWAKFPLLYKYYPARALEDRVKGVVIVACTVGSEGQPVGCAVLSETPAGYGFGDATVKALEEGGRVDQETIKEGQKFRLTIRFEF